uniref:Zinc finger A20 and AN1 domain-containing stress-associated protein 7 (Trinotate prediction) n=1 Tax=Myxobolus squamalis TaxID=59785 RepID=A0A6B2FYV3_MYXSQ
MKNMPGKIDETPISSDNEESISASCNCNTQECSDCYPDYLFNAPIVETPEIICQELAELKESAETLDPPSEEPKDTCYNCNKKLTFSGIKCKCDHYFCFCHRHPEQHNCTFDFKESGRATIGKQNPKIFLDKIKKF